MHKNRGSIYVVFILIQSLVYGLGNPLTKIAYESVTPLWCLTFRFAIAFAAFMIVRGKSIIKELKTSRVRDYLPTSLCMALAYICCNLALKFTSAMNVGFLMSLPVIFVPILEKIFYRKRFFLRYGAIQLIVLGGLYLLCSNGGQFHFGRGDLLAVLTAALIAGALVFGEQPLKQMDAVTISTTQVGLTMVISLISALMFDSVQVVAGITMKSWAVIVYLALACSCLAYLLQNVALHHLKSATVSLLQCTQPIMTALIAWLLLGETLTVSGLLGGLFIIAGLIAGSRIVK